MLIGEVPPQKLFDFLVLLKESGEKPDLAVPESVDLVDDIKALAISVLKKDKGSGYAGRLIALCEYDELPSSVTALLNIVYGKFKKPAPVPPLDPLESEVVSSGESTAETSTGAAEGTGA